MALETLNCYVPYGYPQPVLLTWPVSTWTLHTSPVDPARVEALEAKVARLERHVKRLRRAQYNRQKREQ